MTDDRDFKRLVRQRMAETGESYTAARAALRPPGPTPTGATNADQRSAVARWRELYTRTSIESLGDHLETTYGTRVTATVEMDLGVYRIDRASAPSWVARVFAARRPLEATREDAAFLAHLAAAGIRAERLAADVHDAVSVLDGQGVLVTQFIAGPNLRGRDTPDVSASLGAQLGQVHALPLDGAPDREAGGWHHLAIAGGGRDVDVAILTGLLEQTEPGASPDERAARAELCDELRQVDVGDGLPEALVHPDPCGANAIADEDGVPTLVDWTGAGRGPRLLSFANLVANANDLAAVDAAVTGYRASVDLTADELDRLEGVLTGFPLILDCWMHLFHGQPAREAVTRRASPRQRATTIAARVRAAFAAPYRRPDEATAADQPKLF